MYTNFSWYQLNLKFLVSKFSVQLRTHLNSPLKANCYFFQKIFLTKNFLYRGGNGKTKTYFQSGLKNWTFVYKSLHGLFWQLTTYQPVRWGWPHPQTLYQCVQGHADLQSQGQLIKYKYHLIYKSKCPNFHNYKLSLFSFCL